MAKSLTPNTSVVISPTPTGSSTKVCGVGNVEVAVYGRFEKMEYDYKIADWNLQTVLQNGTSDNSLINGLCFSPRARHEKSTAH